MTPRPLFIPLNGCYFDAFAAGTKRIEWRVYGPRWNRQVAYRGRPVTLSRGYSGARLAGTIVQTRRVPASRAPEVARALFPQAKFFCAIHLALNSDGIASSARAD